MTVDRFLKIRLFFAVIQRAALRKMFGVGRVPGVRDLRKDQQPFHPNPAWSETVPFG